MIHLGILENTQEARIAPGYASSNSYASLHGALQTSLRIIIKYNTDDDAR